MAFHIPYSVNLMPVEIFSYFCLTLILKDRKWGGDWNLNMCVTHMNTFLSLADK